MSFPFISHYIPTMVGFVPPLWRVIPQLFPEKNLQNHLQFWGNFPQNDHQFCSQLPNGKAIATHGGPMAPWAASRRDFARCRAAARGRPSSKDLGRSQIGIACMYIIYGAYVFLIHLMPCVSGFQNRVALWWFWVLNTVKVKPFSTSTVYSCPKCMQAASTANFKGGAGVYPWLRDWWRILDPYHAKEN